MVSRSFCSGILLALVAAAGSQRAAAQSFDSQTSMMQQCATALHTDNVASNASALTKLATSSVFGSSESAGTNASAGGSAGVYSGSASYGSQSSSSMNSVSLSDFQKEQLSSLLSSTLSLAGAAAFNACINNIFGSPGLHISTVSADSDQVTLRVKYVPQVGTSQPSLKLRITSNAPLVQGQDLRVKATGYDSSIIFNVENPGRAVRILIAVITPSGAVTAESTEIRPIVSIHDFTDRKPLPTTGFSTAGCGGFHHSQTVTGPTVTLQADPGYTLDPLSVRVLRGSVAYRTLSAPEPWGTPSLLPPDAPTAATAYANCTVPDGNNFYSANIALGGDEVSSGTYLQLPVDNNKPVPMIVYN